MRFVNYYPTLLVLLLSGVMATHAGAQFSKEQLKFNYALSGIGSGEVMVINDYYLLLKDPVYLNVYSMQTGLLVKKFLYEYHSSTNFSYMRSYSPDDELVDRIFSYYAKNFGDIQDASKVPAPDWKKLHDVEYLAAINGADNGVIVHLGDGSVREFIFDVAKFSGAYHYCSDRNSLVIVKSDPKLGIYEVSDKNEVKAFKGSAVSNCRDIQISGTKVITNEMVFDLFTGKNIFDLSTFGNVNKPRFLGEKYVCYRTSSNGGTNVLVDITTMQKVLELPAEMTYRAIGANLKYYVEYKKSFDGYNIRAFIKRLDGSDVIEVVSPQSIKDYNDSVESAVAYEKELDLNDQIYKDYLTNSGKILADFNKEVARFKSEAVANGWKLISHVKSKEKQSKDIYVAASYSPDDSLKFYDEKNYWVIGLCALPTLRTSMQFWTSVPNFPWLEMGGSEGDGMEFTHDYFIFHTGLIHPDGIPKFDIVYQVSFNHGGAEYNYLADGISQTLIFEKPANSENFEMPEFSGTIIPQYYFGCFDERFLAMKEQYKENIKAEAERARIEALKRIPQFTEPQPGSALYNLQMAIDAAVPSTWNTCLACGGTGLSSSRCACCSGQGSIVVKRQVFHEMSQKTDVVYRPDGEQGAGYYNRTTPIGYYKTESSYQNCDCCAGSGILTGTGVCSSCGGAGRIKP